MGARRCRVGIANVADSTLRLTIFQFDALMEPVGISSNANVDRFVADGRGFHHVKKHRVLSALVDF